MIDNDADFPLTQEAEDYLAIIERRIEQGLVHHPFPDGAWSGLIKLNEDGTPYNCQSQSKKGPSRGVKLVH